MAKKKKRKIFRTAIGFGYMIIGCILIYTLFDSGMAIYQKQKELSIIEKEKEKIEAEKEQLHNEIELLGNEDYVTRYARENYVFTRDGEEVIHIPGVSE